MNRLFSDSFNLQLQSHNDNHINMNYRNGFIKKKVDTLFGTIELDIPRDRKNIVSNSLILSKLLYPFSHYITYLYSNGLSISNIRFFLHLFLGYDYSYFQMKKNITYCLKNHTLIREKENDFGYKTILINIYTLKNSFDSFIFFLSKHENSYHVIGFYKVIDDLNASFAFALDNLFKTNSLNDVVFIFNYDNDILNTLQDKFPKIIIQFSIPEFTKKESSLIADDDMKTIYHEEMKLIYQSDTSKSAKILYKKLLNKVSFSSYKKDLYPNGDHLFNFLDHPAESRKTYSSLHGFHGYKKRLKIALNHVHIKKMSFLEEYIDFTVQNYEAFISNKN